MSAAESHHLQIRPQAGHLADHLWSLLFMAFLFIGTSLLSSPIPGVNEPHYLTKSRAFDDPSWCSRDFFLSSGNAHSCFFALAGVATRFLTFDQIALYGRIISSILFSAGFWIFARSVFTSGYWQRVAALMFVILSLTGDFSGEWLLGGFESKVPSWAFSLAGAGLWLKSQSDFRYRLIFVSGLCVGIACALHPVAGGWVAVCIVGSDLSLALFSVANRRRLETRRSLALLIFGLTTTLVALPGLIPAVRLVLDTSLSPEDRQLASFIQVFWRLRHHLDPTEITRSQWMWAVMLTGICMACMTAVSRPFRSRHPREGEGDGRDGALRCGVDQTAIPVMGLLLVMSAIIAAAGVLIGWHSGPAKFMTGWTWRAVLLKFYPFRCFDGLLPISAGIFVSALLARLSAADLFRSRTERETLNRGVVRQLVAETAVISSAIIVLVIVSGKRDVPPPGYSREQFQEWKVACQWIREQTPPDALILTPRESFAFKWYAERAEYVCYKDCPQDAAGILEWNRRLWFLHNWTRRSSSDGLYDVKDLKTLQGKTGCDYILTRVLGPFETTPIWQGTHWNIYDAAGP